MAAAQTPTGLFHTPARSIDKHRQLTFSLTALTGQSSSGDGGGLSVTKLSKFRHFLVTTFLSKVAQIVGDFWDYLDYIPFK